jgi:hypothetical protein
MNFDSEYLPEPGISHLIERASARTGFSPAEIAAMVNSDLETDYLLDYITAVLTDQMN